MHSGISIFASSTDDKPFNSSSEAGTGSVDSEGADITVLDLLLLALATGAALGGVDDIELRNCKMLDILHEKGLTGSDSRLGGLNTPTF